MKINIATYENHKYISHKKYYTKNLIQAKMKIYIFVTD